MERSQGGTGPLPAGSSPHRAGPPGDWGRSGGSSDTLHRRADTRSAGVAGPTSMDSGSGAPRGRRHSRPLDRWMPPQVTPRWGGPPHAAPHVGSAPPRESPSDKTPPPGWAAGGARVSAGTLSPSTKKCATWALSHEARDVPWRAAPRNGPRDLSCTLGRPRSHSVTWARPQPPSRETRRRRVTRPNATDKSGACGLRHPSTPSCGPSTKERRRSREAGVRCGPRVALVAGNQPSARRVRARDPSTANVSTPFGRLQRHREVVAAVASTGPDAVPSPSALGTNHERR